MEDRIPEDEFEELGDEQKVAIGRWFLMNAPPGQVLQVAKGNKKSCFYPDLCFCDVNLRGGLMNEAQCFLGLI